MLIFVFSTIFTFYLPYFAFMAVYLYALQPVLALALVLIFVPTAVTQYVRSTVFTELEDEAAPKRREFEYYERCLVHREYFKETRHLGGAVDFFRDLYLRALRSLQVKQWRAHGKTALLELGMNVISLAGLGGVLYLLISSLLAGGDISVGSFAAVFASLNLMFSLMEEILVRHFGMLSKTMGTVRNFIRYLDLEERKGKAIAAGAANIVVKNASFTYPGASSPSLKRINLEVRRGETLAIVGQNGAGKSTLVRLLTGIYLPDEGEVLVHGVSTKELAPPRASSKGYPLYFKSFSAIR